MTINKAVRGLHEQLDKTSLMTVQNTIALDMLLAEKGGVCRIIGSTCCTFIPNNTAPDGSITRALEGLESLSKEWAKKLRNRQSTHYYYGKMVCINHNISVPNQLQNHTQRNAHARLYTNKIFRVINQWIWGWVERHVSPSPNVSRRLALPQSSRMHSGDTP